MRILPLVALLLGASTSWAQTARRIDDCDGVYRTKGIAEVAIQGITGINRVCQIIHRSSRNHNIVGYQVLVRPSYGILGSADGAGRVGGTYLTAYKPNEGFVGVDNFEIELRYRRDDGSEQTTRIRIAMTVKELRKRR